jgi:hypothetical protein
MNRIMDQKEVKRAALGRATSNLHRQELHISSGVGESHDLCQRGGLRAIGDFAHGAGGSVLFVRFDMSDLSTVCTFALGSLWLRFASDGVIWDHGRISRRWRGDALGFLAGEPTVFILLQACKLIFEARGLIVSIFANRGKEWEWSCRLRLRASTSASPVGMASASLHLLSAEAVSNGNF